LPVVQFGAGENAADIVVSPCKQDLAVSSNVCV